MSLTSSLSRAFPKKRFVCSECRDRLAQNFGIRYRRSITRNHLRNIKIAAEEWQERKKDVEDGKAQSVLDMLEERGLVNQIVGNRNELNKLLLERRVGVYCGVDPTAASLHVGHMIPFMVLGWMYIYGYAATYLMGGFTARIGDPTDRLTARAEVGSQERTRNALNMFEQLKKLGTNTERYAESKGYLREWAWRRSVLNNNTWWQKTTVADYMRIMGRHIRVGPMLGRDSVKNRLEKGDGMSYAEFSYPLIQAWDWWHMFQTGTQLQVGGADQFGNILAGAEAVKSIMKEDIPFMKKLAEDTKDSETSNDPMGFTVPLLTTSKGEKFGKSAGNAIWIDRQYTSSYDLYQFFVRTADDDVERYLKLLTFLRLPEIEKIMAMHEQDRSKRVAQHTLAHNFLELVHGRTAADEAQGQHLQLFSNTLKVADIQKQMQEKPAATPDERPADINPSLNKYAKPLDQDSSYDVNIKLPRSLVIEQPLSRILYAAGLAASRSEGQRLVNSKGVYIGGRVGKGGVNTADEDQINFVPAPDGDWSVVEPLILGGNLLILRTGKWKKKFIEIVSDEEYEASGLTNPSWQRDAETSSEPEGIVTPTSDSGKTGKKPGRTPTRNPQQKATDKPIVKYGIWTQFNERNKERRKIGDGLHQDGESPHTS